MTAIKHHSSSAAASNDRNLRSVSLLLLLEYILTVVRSSSKSTSDAVIASKRETDELHVSMDEVGAEESRVHTVIMDARCFTFFAIIIFMYQSICSSNNRKHLLDKDDDNTLYVIF